MVVPAGAPIREAAAWVGAACAAELAVHEVLTAWLAVEGDPEWVPRWWSLRARRAEVAEAWHRRLPELREMPREGFVALPSPDLAPVLDEVTAIVDPGAAVARSAALGAVLDALVAAYDAHRGVAVGPADAPVARTLAEARAAAAADRDQLTEPPSAEVAAALAAAGGLV